MASIPFDLLTVFHDIESGFLGNTSSVLFLEQAPEENWLKSCASHFNQPASTFLWPSPEQEEGVFQVRWLAPDGEIGLCGHGSLAAIAAVFERKPDLEHIKLKFKGGEIEGSKSQDSYTMKIKAIPLLRELPIPPLLQKGLGVDILEYYESQNKNLVIIADEEALKDMKPDFQVLRQMDTFGYIVSAKGATCDVASRTLVPHVQQLEDHATGSSHSVLIPYWWKKFKAKHSLRAHQFSPRGGVFLAHVEGDWVHLAGKAKVLATGEYLA